MSTRILIIGFSSRAAAASARRAGFEPIAIDFFGDRDLVGTSFCVKDYPAGLLQAAEQLPAAPFIYTGALENHPQIIDQIADGRRLLGNPAPVVQAVRDVEQLAGACAAVGCPMPAMSSSPASVPTDGSWLTKRANSCGGGSVHPWYGESLRTGREYYFQQRVEGTLCSAVFVATDSAAILLGVTGQLAGAAWAGAREFKYCGSIGPFVLSPALTTKWAQLGQALASEFQLRGLFNVDAIVQREQLWPLEVNPRYSASVEVLERSLSMDAIRLHVSACDSNECLPPANTRSNLAGKAVIYAPHDLTVNARFMDFVQSRNAEASWPDVADIPHEGSHIAAHQPLCTVFATASDHAEVLQNLQKIAAAVLRLFDPNTENGARE